MFGQPRELFPFGALAFGRQVTRRLDSGDPAIERSH
jgi:hypothetical protein